MRVQKILEYFLHNDIDQTFSPEFIRKLKQPLNLQSQQRLLNLLNLCVWKK